MRSIRLSKEDEQKLEYLAEQRGMTISDLIRDMIRNGCERHAVIDALQEIRKAAGNLIAHKARSTDNQDIDEIKRLVTLIALAMPAVASQLRELDGGSRYRR